MKFLISSLLNDGKLKRHDSTIDSERWNFIIISILFFSFQGNIRNSHAIADVPHLTNIIKWTRQWSDWAIEFYFTEFKVIWLFQSRNHLFANHALVVWFPTTRPEQWLHTLRSYFASLLFCTAAVSKGTTMCTKDSKHLQYSPIQQKLLQPTQWSVPNPTTVISPALDANKRNGRNIPCSFTRYLHVLYPPHNSITLLTFQNVAMPSSCLSIPVYLFLHFPLCNAITSQSRHHLLIIYVPFSHLSIACQQQLKHRQ